MDSLVSLQQLGFNQNEAKLYLFLLQNGASTGPELQAALEIAKVPTYRAINALKAKGYIEALGETRNQRFVARPAQTLLHAYDAQAKQLASARTGIEALIRNLADRQNDLYKQNKITVYEGKEGYRLWNEQRLGDDVDMIREGGNDHFVLDFFSPDEVAQYITSYITRRVKKGIPIRVLHNQSEPLIDWDHSNPATLKETRAVALPAHLQIYMSVFGTKFGFYTRQGNRYLGIVVDDHMLANMMIWFFDTIWNTGKKV